MLSCKQLLTRSLLLAMVIPGLLTFSPQALGQTIPSTPASGSIPGGPLYPYASPDYGYVSPVYPMTPIVPAPLPYYGDLYPFGGPSYAYVNPIYAPAPIVPSPIVGNAVVPAPVVPNLNVTPNAPWSPGTLNPNLYGIRPYGSAPETVIWGGAGVRPFWFDPFVP